MLGVHIPDIEGLKYKIYTENKKIFETDTIFSREIAQRHVLSTQNYEFFEKNPKIAIFHWKNKEKIRKLYQKMAIFGFFSKNR